MTVPSIIYAQYAPQRIKVDSLGIGMTHESNLAMNLDNNQFLIVGQFEKPQGDDQTSYNLIVDHEGVAIRTSIPDRQNIAKEYALYVDGDTYITGKLYASSLTVLSGNGDVLQPNEGQTSSTVEYWSPAVTATSMEGLFFNGKVTIGNKFQSRSNAHAINIAESADRNIEHAQINIHNTQRSQIRLGILGTASDSPAIINTKSGTRLEFHAGRDQSYFDHVYKTVEYQKIINATTGQEQSVQIVVNTETPNYSNIAMSPHMMLDEHGHVGIHTSYIPTLEFEMRRRDYARPQEIHYYPAAEKPALYVSRSAYACNLLMWDQETATVKHLDDLYVRRMGVTIPANQILPGAFAHGDYTFVCNVSIGGPPDERYDLKVYGTANMSNAVVDHTLTTSQLVAETAMINTAGFCNDVYMNRDVIVNQSIRLRGQIFMESFSNTPTGESVQTWERINFSPVTLSADNISPMGNGFSTRGRVGIGAITSGFFTDAVNHQLTVIKRDNFSSAFPNMFELELLDKTSPYSTIAAWIGHPRASNMYDGSLVFATPSSSDGDYFSLPKKQNMYFYPGEKMSGGDPHIIRPENPPTLSVHEEKRVGMLTFNPISTLDVRGTITFSDKLQYYNENNSLIFTLGLWKAQLWANPYSNENTPRQTPTFRGIQYYDEDAPHVGVNTIPDINYGMVVSGGFKSKDGYFTKENRKIMPWYDSLHFNSTTNHVAPTDPLSNVNLFTFGNVGVGVKSPIATLEIKDNYRTPDGTVLRMVESDSGNPYSSVEWHGFDETWGLRHNNVERTMEMGLREHMYGVSNDRLFVGKYNRYLKKYQYVIGCNLTALDAPLGLGALGTNDSVLTVGGDMAVLGNINITGQFKVMSQPQPIDPAAPPVVPELRPDDVFIGGANVILTPGSVRNGVVITDNYNSTMEQNTNVDCLFTVHQNNTRSNLLAHFKSSQDKAFIQITNQNGVALKMGVVRSAISEDVTFGFYDRLDHAYLTFKVPNQLQLPNPADWVRYMGVNLDVPSAHLHVATRDFGSNLFRLSKQVIGFESTDRSCPHMDLEKTYPQGGRDVTRWTISGPDASFEEKLAFTFKEDGVQAKEVFTLTKNGCFGIGNTQPEFALDITSTGTRGSLRLLNTDNTATPQLMFQSGDPLFGADDAFDFRMYSSNNAFTFDMQDVQNRIPIFNVNSNGHIGFNTDASDAYQTTFNGPVNITNGTMYINGSSFLEGTIADGGISFNAGNIYLRPNQIYYGGVAINNNQPTCNLFHIFAGANCNVFVLDSKYDECQMHFRSQLEGNMDFYNMYRVAQSNEHMYWAYFPNCGKRYYIEPSKENYSNVMMIGPTADRSQFQMDVFGQIRINADDPTLFLDEHARVGALNSNAYFVSSENIGIGTTAPLAPIHIYSERGNAALRVEQASSFLIAEFAQANTIKTVIDGNGNIGIGTTAPRASIHTQGTVFASDGTAATPAYSFASDSATGLYRDGMDLALATNSVRRMSISQLGQVSIGSNVPVSDTVLSVHQSGSGPVANVSSSAAPHILRIQENGNVGIGTNNPLYPLHIIGNTGCTGSILPSSNEIYDLGSPLLRWKDLYLSGNSIDLSGSRISRDVDGSVRFSCNETELVRVIASEFQLGDQSTDQKVVLVNEPLGEVSFRVTDNATGDDKILRPLFLNSFTQSLEIGDATHPGVLAVAADDKPALVIEQNTNSNIAEFYANGELKIHIDADGRVGIGTSSTEAMLRVDSSTSPASDLANFADQVIIQTNGNVGIHTTVANASLHVGRNSIFNGNVYMSANLEVFGNSLTHGNAVTDSDERLKTDLRQITSALDKVCELTGYTFAMRSDGGNPNAKRHTGLVAQDVLAVFPEAVYTEGEYLGLAYGNLMGLIVESIKELRAEIHEIKQKIM